MTRPAVLAPAARLEFQQAARWLPRREARRRLSWPARLSGVARREFAQALQDMEHAAAAEKLQRAVADAAKRLGENPLLGSVRPHLPPLYRFWSLIRFG